jgi:hypothetical protein
LIFLRPEIPDLPFEDSRPSLSTFSTILPPFSDRFSLSIIYYFFSISSLLRRFPFVFSLFSLPVQLICICFVTNSRRVFSINKNHYFFCRSPFFSGPALTIPNTIDEKERAKTRNRHIPTTIIFSIKKFELFKRSLKKCRNRPLLSPSLLIYSAVPTIHQNCQNHRLTSSSHFITSPFLSHGKNTSPSSELEWFKRRDGDSKTIRYLTSNQKVPSLTN